MGTGALTAIIAIPIAAAFVAVVAKIIIDKKKGKHSCSCGGNCEACGCCSANSQSSAKSDNKQ